MKKTIFILLLFFTNYFSFSQEQNEISIKEKNKNIEVVNYSIIEEPPLFPECKGTKYRLRNCFMNKINIHLSNTFDFDLLKQEGLSDEGHIFIIYFHIGIDGNVFYPDVGMSKKHIPSKIEENLKKSIWLLPKIKPGKKNGKTVVTKVKIVWRL